MKKIFATILLSLSLLPSFAVSSTNFYSTGNDELYGVEVTERQITLRSLRRSHFPIESVKVFQSENYIRFIFENGCGVTSIRILDDKGNSVYIEKIELNVSNELYYDTSILGSKKRYTIEIYNDNRVFCIGQFYNLR